MPSFRLALEVGPMRPGHHPPEVLDALLGHLTGEGYHIDGHDLEVVAGSARLLVRFAVPPSNDAEEDATALAVADGARKAVDRVAQPGRVWVLRRRRGAWEPARWRRDPLVHPEGDVD